jgi:ornithine decarboxylase
VKLLLSPKYVFNSEEIMKCYNLMNGYLDPCEIYYALKANSEIDLLKVLNRINSKFEVASLEEFMKLKSIGVAAENIICGLPIKKNEMIEYLYENGCRYFVFDDIKEFEKINTLAPEAAKIIRIYINDLIPSTIEYGMKIEEIEFYKKNIPDFLSNVNGITFHILDNTDIELLYKVLDRVEMLIDQLDNRQQNIINIGGGYKLNASAEFYEGLSKQLVKLQSKYNVKIMAEPGHAIIDTSGKLLTKVILIKEKDGYSDVYIDAGYASGLRKKPGYVRLSQSREKNNKRRIYRFKSITSSNVPILVSTMKEDLTEGDIIEFGNYGSYSICFSNNFHAWQKPIVEIT